MLLLFELRQAGHTVHIAGLMRLDIEESSVNSICITVWASPYLPLHMGKTENTQIMQEEHFGLQLQVLFCDSLIAHGFFILIISNLCY